MTILIPYSFNGTSLQSTDYETSVPREFASSQITAQVGYIKRAGAVPVMAGKDFQPITVPLEIKCLHTYNTLFSSLNQLFDTKDETPRQLIFTDSDNASKQYYIYATAKQTSAGHDGQMYTVMLAVDDPIWQSVTQNSQTFASTSATDSTSVSVGGNDYAYPIFEITPTAAPSTDYIYGLYLQVLPQSSAPWASRPLCITGATDTTFDTAALVAAGKMQADGDDLRVFRDGVERDRWLSGINTTDTKVWVVDDMPAKQEMTLKTAVASSDTITEIELNYTTANVTAITACPASGRLILDSSLGSTDTEEFTYTSKTISAKKIAFTIDARSVRNTTAFSFSANANVRYLPYDYQIVYGNASDSAPTVDNTRKPIISLTSTNASFIYTGAFYDEAALRAGIWIPHLHQVSDPAFSRSGIFTSTGDGGDTDPASEMGMKILSYRANGAWYPETAKITWDNYFPDGVASITASGEQKQDTLSFPTFGLYTPQIGTTTTKGKKKKTNTTTYSYIATIFTVSAQTSSDYDTWTTWSKASTDSTIPTNTTYLEFLFSGTVLGSDDHEANVGVDAITVGLTNYPHVMLRTEATSAKLNLTLYNNTSGESFDVVYPLPVNDTLIIDTDPDFPTAKYKGQIVNGAIKLSTIRAAWLAMTPGTNSIGFTNNLSVANDLSIAIKWRDRLNFF